ncbi:MAG: APC family permease [Candidatus Roizmanbacteria bacterium]
MTTNAPKQIHTKLNQLYATAICGNDILSSCLYVSGIAAIYAGVLAPIVLLIVGIVLYFFRFVYTEVVEALPINGGAYNCLLNATSKPIAAVAGVMTILSYVATACISAKIGVEYFSRAFAEQIGHFNTNIGAIALLAVFAVLVISGLKDSAKVALGIFLLHIVTLLIIIVLGIEHAYVHGFGQFLENFVATRSIVFSQGGIILTIYFAFSASLLGVSGFESSANFVEEQAPGVFRKTLRNMWLGVTIFNPIIALIALNSLPLSVINQAKDFMLADVGFSIGVDLPFTLGQVLIKDLVAVDALLVLSGAVLTAYVGVGGLIQRMALDGCLPKVLTRTNSRGSFPVTVLTFLFLCSSILIMTKGQLLSLAGVYTIAFLGVMTLFAFGNLILKRERQLLKRTFSAPVSFVIIALVSTAVGMVGNMILDERNVEYFMIYFIPTVTIVMIMIYQDYVFEFLLNVSVRLHIFRRFFRRIFDSIVRLKIIIFINQPHRLHDILKYVARNEIGRNIILISCRSGAPKSTDTSSRLAEIIPVLKDAGVYDYLDITLDTFDMPFGPEAVKYAVKKYRVPANRILIGSIHKEHQFEYDELGGVRIIF